MLELANKSNTLHASRLKKTCLNLYFNHHITVKLHIGGRVKQILVHILRDLLEEEL